MSWPMTVAKWLCCTYLVSFLNFLLVSNITTARNSFRLLYQMSLLILQCKPVYHVSVYMYALTIDGPIVHP
jgi:hypothetical protein